MPRLIIPRVTKEKTYSMNTNTNTRPETQETHETRDPRPGTHDTRQGTHETRAGTWYSNAVLSPSTLEAIVAFRREAGREGQLVSSYNLRYLINDIEMRVTLEGQYAAARGLGGRDILIRGHEFLNADTRKLVEGLESIYCVLGTSAPCPGDGTTFGVGVRFTLRRGQVWVN